MNALSDFVPGGYPLPWNPVTMGEFVPGGFPLPQNPVFFVPSANGSLPKAPDMPMALIGARNGKAAAIAAATSPCDGMGCGCGGSCGCGGLGDIPVPTWASSLPPFLQGSVNVPGLGNTPTVYVAGIGLVVVMLVFMGGRSRRRR